jgi:hypothetical protein
MSSKLKIYNIGDKKSKINSEYIMNVAEKENGATEYTLCRSHSDCWSEPCRGEKILSLVDDGNGYNLDRSLGKKVAYDVMAEFYIMLQFIKVIDGPIYEGVITEETIIGEF